MRGTLFHMELKYDILPRLLDCPFKGELLQAAFRTVSREQRMMIASGLQNLIKKIGLVLK